MCCPCVEKIVSNITHSRNSECCTLANRDMFHFLISISSESPVTILQQVVCHLVSLAQYSQGLHFRETRVQRFTNNQRFQLFSARSIAAEMPQSVVSVIYFHPCMGRSHQKVFDDAVADKTWRFCLQ